MKQEIKELFEAAEERKSEINSLINDITDLEDCIDGMSSGNFSIILDTGRNRKELKWIVGSKKRDDVATLILMMLQEISLSKQELLKRRTKNEIH